MSKPLFASAALLALALPAQAVTLAQWNFNDNNLVVDLGTGTAALVGGTTTSGFNSGAGSSDPVQPGTGWSISTFAAQGTGNATRGASFTVSTAGYENISFSYDMRHSNTAPGSELVQYSVDGLNFVNLGTFTTVNPAGATPFFARSIDLSSITGADDADTLTFRVVATFGPGGVYESSAIGSNYGTSGTWRFDMVTISGDVISAVPEPSSYAMLLAGLAAVGFMARRRRG